MIDAPPDLLVIGGLTVDRFADGSSAPGGSVLHIARAAAQKGISTAVITAAGPESEALAGMAKLRGFALSVDSTMARSTATFIHRDSPAGRRLWLERRGGRISLADLASRPTPRAILVAPIADEIASEQLAYLDPAPIRGAILQGFLRSFGADGEVRPIPLSALTPGLAEGLGRFDLLVASREDLLAEASEPAEQLASLRRSVGPRPALVVTDGVGGVWTEGEHLAVPRVVGSVSSVGAGDMLAAFMLAGPWPQPAAAIFVRQRAQAAMLAVAEALEERRGPPR